MGASSQKSNSTAQSVYYEKNPYLLAGSNEQTAANNIFTRAGDRANAVTNFMSNPLTTSLTDALTAKAYGDYTKDFAQAYSAKQGLGQNVQMSGLADVYSNYKNAANLQLAQALTDQYNKTVEQSANADSIAASLIQALIREQGYAPVVTNSSSGWGFNL